MSATATHDSVKSLINASFLRVHQMLPNIDTMTDEQLAAVLFIYRSIIEPDFIPWLASTWGRCYSSVAQAAAWDNLVCEVGDNHPKMLRDFVAPLDGKYPYPKQAIDRCHNLSLRVSREVATDSVSALLVMALLENTSLTFIEWMRDAARRLGLTDLTYLDVHGEADKEHADEFVRATDAEVAECGPQPRQETVKAVEDYLTAIFNAHLT